MYGFREKNGAWPFIDKKLRLGKRYINYGDTPF